MEAKEKQETATKEAQKPKMNPMLAKQQEHLGRMVRILGTDVDANMAIYPALTKIKGISWSIANAVCVSLRIDKKTKVGALNEADIKKISEFIKKPTFSKFLLNRRKDRETGEDGHIVGTDLELKKEFDIKRLKQIRSYKGLRHYLNLPVRGQRTKSHFRRNRSKGVGIKKKAAGAAK